VRQRALPAVPNSQAIRSQSEPSTPSVLAAAAGARNLDASFCALPAGTLEALEEALIVRPAPRPALTCPPALASPPRRAPLPRALTRAVSSGGGRSPACC